MWNKPRYTLKYNIYEESNIKLTITNLIFTFNKKKELIMFFKMDIEGCLKAKETMASPHTNIKRWLPSCCNCSTDHELDSKTCTTLQYEGHNLGNLECCLQPSYNFKPTTH